MFSKALDSLGFKDSMDSNEVPSDSNLGAARTPAPAVPRNCRALVGCGEVAGPAERNAGAGTPLGRLTSPNMATFRVGGAAADGPLPCW
eukprot:2375710-Prymnesium_polylepis.1